MVIRKYESKPECVSLLIEEDFNTLDSTLVTELSDWYENWSFVSNYDECDHEDEDPDDIEWFDYEEELVYYDCGYTMDGTPAWPTWFEPVGFLYDWCKRNLHTVAECGFVLVFHNDEFWGLAVDGAGYSFRDTHFTRLYDAVGLKWHEL